MSDPFTGWPIRCPQCSSLGFVYKSDRTGNQRMYRCKECGVRYVAVIKDRRSRSAATEPTNLSMQDLAWRRIPDGSMLIRAEKEPLAGEETQNGKANL